MHNFEGKRVIFMKLSFQTFLTPNLDCGHTLSFRSSDWSRKWFTDYPIRPIHHSISQVLIMSKISPNVKMSDYRLMIKYWCQAHRIGGELWLYSVVANEKYRLNGKHVSVKMYPYFWVATVHK